MTERWEEIAEVRGHQTAPELQQKEGRIRQHHSSKEEAKMGVNCSQHGLGHTLSLSADTSAKGFIETCPAFHRLQYTESDGKLGGAWERGYPGGIIILIMDIIDYESIISMF